MELLICLFVFSGLFILVLVWGFLFAWVFLLLVFLLLLLKCFQRDCGIHD